jgi:heptosyltransferase-2
MPASPATANAPTSVASSAARAPAILLVRFGSLGDVVLTFGAAESLARARPDATLVYLVKREYAELVRAQPWASEVWELPADERGAAEWGAWRARIAERSFEAVVDWQTSPRSRALLAGHPRRLAWRAERWLRRRWVSLKWTRPKAVTPAWLRYARALAPLGVREDALVRPRVVAPEADRAAAAAEWAAWDAAAGRGETIAFAPGARWATKRWPAESYLALGRALVAQGARVLVTGDAPDRAALPELERWAREEPRARWPEGSLTRLVARLELCARAVTNDTGVMHVAAAAGLDVVAIFGSTHPALGFAPLGERNVLLSGAVPCLPCSLHGRPRCPLGHHRCVRDVSVAQVETALASLGNRREGG